MAQYTVKDPQGNNRVIQGPDGASDNEIIAQAQKLFLSPTQLEPKETSMMDVMKQGAQAALPSPAFNEPLTPTSSNPAIGGAETALQTLRDPTRISATLSEPGKALSESGVGQAVQTAGENIGIPKPVSKFAV